MIRTSSSDYDELILSQELSLYLGLTLVKLKDMVRKHTLAAIVIDYV